MNDSGVLNPHLYYALRARFSAVRIANEGAPFLGHTTVDALTKRTKVTAVDAGEYYRVCCPYCNDKRFRLYINHMWNTLDKSGKPSFRWMANCFNENCDLSGLVSDLRVYVKLNVKTPAQQKAVSSQDMFKAVTLPGVCVDLHKLPSSHPAIRYIEQRKFDPAYLEKDWGVCYCESAERDDNGRIPGTNIVSNLVANRLMIPVYYMNRLVGWQARAINDWSMPKYYTMPGLNKNFMLFNGDRAKEHRFGVIVEGVFDAFRVGLRAAALLGKSMSFHQRTLVHTYWGSGALCILLDPDAIEDMDNITKLLNPNAFRWGAFAMTLPDERDPAEYDSQALWELIASYARNRGIELSSV